MSDQRVFVVDDDASVRKALTFSLTSAGLPVTCFPSAEGFMTYYRTDLSGCIVLDMKMPGMGGLTLQSRLSRRGVEIPVIFLTGHGDVPICTEAMKHGAVDFIEKPCDEDRLLESIERAFALDRQLRQNADHREAFATRYEMLTEREKEVMELLVAGAETKTIASRLGIAGRTVDNHRAAVLDKMRVENSVTLASFVIAARHEPRRTNQ